MHCFTDIHSHFLYGLDDGAKNRETMNRMLDAAHKDGICHLFATPHVSLGLEPFQSDVFKRHLKYAKAYVKEAGYSLKLYSGAEILYTPFADQLIRQRELVTLGGTEYVLMEFVPDISLKELRGALDCMAYAGYVTVIAHMERYRCMFRGSNAKKIFSAYNVRYQMNASSLTDGIGYFKDRKVRRWLREGMISFVANDAHSVQARGFSMRKAYKFVAEAAGKQEADRIFSNEEIVNARRAL